jgi:hypothetical protein
VFAAVSAATAVREPSPFDRAAPAPFAERDRKKLVGHRYLVGHESRTFKGQSRLRVPRTGEGAGRHRTLSDTGVYEQ